MLNQIDDILNRQVSGFHQYALTAPIRLTYVSQNLRDMLLVQDAELPCGKKDTYAQFIHPADRERYGAFLRSLSESGQTKSEEYRLVRKDGSVLWVKDTISTALDEHGGLFGSSVLTDITDLKKEHHDLQFLNDTIPCGFLKYTCGKQPQITYINQTMLDMLRIPESNAGELDYLELYKSNIFLLIPMEERRRFSRYLNRVYTSETPIAGDMTLLRCDGTRAHVFGWVTKQVDSHGNEEFQSVCMDMTERHGQRKDMETQQYLKALTDVYDKIFAFDLDANTLTCLHCEPTSSFRNILQIAMQIDSAAEQWIVNSVAAEDQNRVRGFFHDFCQKKLYGPDAKPPQITYQAHSSEGTLCQYIGTFIKASESVSYYCCRRVLDAHLRAENDKLREGMKALVTRFMDGFAAFEISADGLAKPLYSSENVYEFFGYTEEEWLALMEKFTPIDNFIANCVAGQENFETLLRTGEAEFVYYDYKTDANRHIKAVCSQREADGRSPRYVMLYNLESASERADSSSGQQVFVRTFGYFDVFVGEQPIAFRNKKAKELLALLVDRRGGYISSEEAICALWEDEPVNSATLARYRKAALQLKNTLEEYGVAEIIESVDGKRRIIPEKVQCDLYQYLTGKDEFAQLFKGSYLTNYSWSEVTLGELIGPLE